MCASKAKKRSYKYCIVPMCKNTTVSSPGKLFFLVPSDPERRKNWMIAIKRRRDDIPSPKSTLYCCEDHFTLEEDLDNYFIWKLVGGNNRLRVDVVPHKFHCQNRKKEVSKRSLIKKIKKRKRNEFVENIISKKESINSNFETDKMETQESDSTPNESLTASKWIQCNIALLKNVQPIVHLRSKGVQCKLDLSLKTDKAVQAVVAQTPLNKLMVSDIFSSSSTMFSPSVNDIVNSVSLSSEKDESDLFKSECKRMTLNLCLQNSIFYLGIQQKNNYIVNIFSESNGLKLEDVVLTIRKIRRNEPFSVLGDYFGTTKSQASDIFRKCLPILRKSAEDFIISPQNDKIFQNLPIPFRFGFSETTYIIDCLEIQIQKPSDPFKQAATWSSYKNANTAKYLICCTGDGLITFVSAGFGGCMSDTQIIKKSGFLDTIRPESVIMADRGFKFIETELTKRGCRLIRPPSVSSKQIGLLSKDDVVISKKIASLRIHVERLIRRVRDFSFLGPHSTVNINLLTFLNDAVVLACALINTQTPVLNV